ncbi:FtsX-like permease family protein [Actinoplanes sp. GCM10030250]|uniref:FtsX-like permease family protein n=1 Tax=Actinoplanes sp. GCM10030250 TaxID=3273376 RepID=UPI003623AB51
MIRLALRMLRHRPGSALATFAALAAGAMILTSLAVLVESGLRYRTPPQRYAAVDLVIADRDMTVTGKDLDGSTMTSRITLPEGGTLPADLVRRLRDVRGVTAAAGDRTIPLLTASGPAQGHGWGSAVLRPYTIGVGNAPERDDQIVLATHLAGGLRPGAGVDLVIGGVAARYRISGLTDAGTDTVFFTEARAAALAPRGDRIDAVGVTLAPDADRGAVDRLAAEAGAEVYAGPDRGALERTGDTAAASLLVQVGGSFGGYVVLLVVFVVAGTVGLSVRHRRRDFALLRAVAATPGQVRRMVTAEAGLVSVAGVAVGVPAGLAGAHRVHDELITRGFLPAGFPLLPGVLSAAAVALLTVLVAVLAALLAARRVTAIRPVEALGEIAVEPGGSGWVRLTFGLLTLAGAAGSSAVTVGAGGQVALAGAIGMLYLYVTAVALLAPWINRGATRVLAPVLVRVWGVSGHLAVANLRANAQGMATVLTALVLSVGFGGSVWFLQDNLERGTLTQAREGMLAQQTLSSPAGLAPTAAAKIREMPGVEAATAVRRTSVVVKIFGGDAEVVPAQAVDDVSTLDLGVSAGRLADLRGDTIAVSSIRAGGQGWKVGDQVSLWLGDGTPVRLRVAAIYERGLGYGDAVLPRDVVIGHTARGTDDEVLIKGELRDTSLFPAATLISTGQRTGLLAADLALSAWLNKLLVGVMIGYAALAAANTMVMAALARRRELALLRIVGVTRRQARRMVHAEQAGLLGVALVIGGGIAALTLVAVVRALTGSLVPYVPLLGWVSVVVGTALLALATTILPIGRLLRVPPLEHLGVKE